MERYHIVFVLFFHKIKSYLNFVWHSQKAFSSFVAGYILNIWTSSTHRWVQAIPGQTVLHVVIQVNIIVCTPLKLYICHLSAFFQCLFFFVSKFLVCRLVSEVSCLRLSELVTPDKRMLWFKSICVVCLC